MATETITKEEFDAFNRVRDEGKYNMVMEADQAAKEAGLSRKNGSILSRTTRNFGANLTNINRLNESSVYFL